MSCRPWHSHPQCRFYRPSTVSSRSNDLLAEELHEQRHSVSCSSLRLVARPSHVNVQPLAMVVGREMCFDEVPGTARLPMDSSSYYYVPIMGMKVPCYPNQSDGKSNKTCTYCLQWGDSKRGRHAAGPPAQHFDLRGTGPDWRQRTCALPRSLTEFFMSATALLNSFIRSSGQ